MKFGNTKVIAAFASVAIAIVTATALTAYAGMAAGTGLVGSKHDIGAFGATQAPGAVTADSEGRICVFCHTPHSAVVDATKGPTWNHTITTKGYTAYKTATFDSNNGYMVDGDPLAGSSRLCMSCHDGVNASDSHGGTTPQTGTFTLSGIQVVGSESSTTSDHPIGISYEAVRGVQPTKYQNSATTSWSNGHKVAENLETAAGLLTCATCHDVHNKQSYAQLKGTDNVTYNKLLRGRQAASVMCRNCHML